MSGCTHKWYSSRYGGAFCLRCDETLSDFHVVDGVITPTSVCCPEVDQ